MLTRATDADVPAIVGLMNVAFRAIGPGASWNSEADIIDRSDQPSGRAIAARIMVPMHARPSG